MQARESRCNMQWVGLHWKQSEYLGKVKSLLNEAVPLIEELNLVVNFCKLKLDSEVKTEESISNSTINNEMICEEEKEEIKSISLSDFKSLLSDSELCSSDDLCDC